jgi:glycosyltransferase involved in cell wall biosynthesis
VRPARVLYLSYLGGLGGGESSLLTHIAELDRERFAPRVICGTAGAFVNALAEKGIPVDVVPFQLPYFRGGVLPTATLSFVPRLWRYLRAQGIALVHCNDLESAYYAAPLASALGLPLVWTCWGWWAVERGWKAGFYERFMARIISPTEQLKDVLTAANPRLEDKVAVVPFGIDVREFAPGARDEALDTELDLPPRAPRVALVARFQDVKGHEFFLEAAKLILQSFPETRFIVAGENVFDTRDADTYKRRIVEMVRSDARLKSRVVFAGFRRDVARILRATDVLVCPSLFESYGIALLEAMGCGVPVVSTNVGGPCETMVEGVTGFLVPPRDPAAIAARVCELLADPELRRKMGEQGRTRVEQNYTIEKSAGRVQAIYEELLA